MLFHLTDLENLYIQTHLDKNTIDLFAKTHFPPSLSRAFLCTAISVRFIKFFLLFFISGSQNIHTFKVSFHFFFTPERSNVA